MSLQQEVVRGAFRAAYDRFTELAAEDAHKAYAETRSDFASVADKALTATFAEFFAAQEDHYHVMSEEQIGEGNAVYPDADYTVIVDEFDGSFNMMHGEGEDPFGPVIGVATEPDPAFEDVVAAGYLDVPSGNLYEAYQGEGAWFTRNWVDTAAAADRISTSGRETVSGETPPNVIVDTYMLSERPDTITELTAIGPAGDYRSWGSHMAKVARGSYDVAVTGNFCGWAEHKLSTAEELAGGYLLVTEAGGAVVDWDGNDVGPQRIGFHEEKPFNVVIAATAPLAEDVAHRIGGDR